MYFEDVYLKVEGLWKTAFSLKDVSKTDSYIYDIMINYQEIDEFMSVKCNEKFSEWEFIMAFAMYQCLTEFGIQKWKKTKAELLHFNEVPIELFEKKFKNNLLAPGNENFLLNYKGLRA